MTNNEKTVTTQRLVIRVSRLSLSFSTTEDGEVVYEDYPLKSSISIAANMREALQSSQILRQTYHRVLVMVDSPVLMIPSDLYDESVKEDYYYHAFPRKDQEVLMSTVLAELSSVAVFPVSKDLRTVLTDAFGNVRFVAALTPLWHHLNQRSYTGRHQKLYAYFHDKRVDVFNFTQNRFKFFNSFEVSSSSDALYFMLAVWKQVGLSPEHDELYLTGDVPERDTLKTELEEFVKRVFLINPLGEFNRSGVAQIKGIPYDLVILYVKGL